MLIASYLLLAHFLSDFGTQNQYIALNKSSSNKILSVHIALLSAVLFLMFLPIVTLKIAIVLTIINGFMHFVTDYITSRLTKKYYQENRMFAFWKVIGIDQLIHTVTLLLSYSLFS